MNKGKYFSLDGLSKLECLFQASLSSLVLYNTSAYWARYKEN
jgi:hypothetical protein